VKTLDRPVRVLIVAPSFDIVGGQSVQAANLLNYLKRESGVEVSFLPINPRLKGLIGRLQKIKYIRTVITSIAYIFTLLFRVPAYDCIHIFSASYCSFLLAPTPAILISKLFGKKVLLNYHSGEAEDHLRRWSRTALPTLRLSDVIIVPSEYLVDIFRKFNLQARAIYNTVETGHYRFRPRHPLKPVFLSNRNFQAHYNVKCVLRAFSLIQSSYSEASLIVAGDGPEAESLTMLSNELGLRNITFAGQLHPKEMRELYNRADIYLNGSEIDNMPLSILEAYACGLPVISTKAGGIPYILTHEKTGILVNLNDHKGMAESAMRLLDDEVLAERIIKNARNECLKYDWENVRREWLSVYNELAGESGLLAERID
jgi:L-malate glycosyltransferase